MSKFDSIYGGRWLKACDLEGKPRKLHVKAAEWQQVGKEREEKLVLTFADEPKSLILNATNARTLAEAWTKNESVWPGRWLEASPVETVFGPGLKVRALPPQKPTREDVAFEVPAGDDIPY